MVDALAFTASAWGASSALVPIGHEPTHPAGSAGEELDRTKGRRI